jgi:propionate CoA-transferase
LTPTIEHGQFGGIPAEGFDFGASYNAEAILETGHMFSFYQGRGVDQAYLGFLEIDPAGNVNVSKRGSTIIGTGGFIDISQKARKVVFCGTLAVRSRAEIRSGVLHFQEHGRPKLVPRVTQVTFSGEFALQRGQQVVYVTEAAVFRLTEEGVRLEEIAPGVELERDVISQMGFRPQIAEPLGAMAPEIFADTALPAKLFPRFQGCRE